MTPEQAKKNDHDLVQEQVDKVRRDRSLGNVITEQRIKKWYEEKYNEKWFEQVKRER